VIGAGDTHPAGAVFALPQRRLIALCAIAFLAVFAEASVSDWSTLYLSADIGLSPGVAASGFSGYALMMLLGHRNRRLLTVDELRRHIESLGPEAYDTMSYYERWIHAITQTLLERGVITVDELGRKMELVKAREAQHG